ncbi:MAG TPA: serine hydrolase domain-containing protein [Anaerolineales bacterium]|nr:serine hydrolase domain-containing protein [Anaerolineales bacterium]
MNIKPFILPSLLAAGGLALARRVIAAPRLTLAPAAPAVIPAAMPAVMAAAKSDGKPSAMPAAAQAGYHSAYAALDAYVESQMRRLNIPGISLAVVSGSRIVHQRGFGLARPGGQTPTPQTPFFIGSLTKSLTALAVMQLVEDGKLSLDTPVQDYLPWFRMADPQASARITIRHLLNQTSGLPCLPGELVLTDFDRQPGALERQMRALARLRLSHLPGETFEYSNLNFNLLGLVITASSGEDYAAYVQKHIFDPLAMRHSYTSKAAAQRHGLAVGHRHWFGRPYPAPNLPVPAGSLASGQLISCAEDLAHYLIAQLNGGRYGDVQILSPAGIAELQRGAADNLIFGTAMGKYAMGWFEIDLGGTRTCSHTGNVPEYSAYMALVPGQHTGLVLLANSGTYGLPPITGELGMGLLALLAGQPPAPIRLDFIQRIMRGLPLLPILQLAGAAACLRRLCRLDSDLDHRPSRGRLQQHLLFPLLPDLALASALVYLRASGLLSFLRLYMPDLAWIARLSGGFAASWAILRTALVARALELEKRNPR